MLLGRLVFFECVLKMYPGLQPWQWLWIQLYPDYMFVREDSELSDKLARAFTSFDNFDDNLIRRQLARITSAMPMLPCFIDEAQILLKKFEGFFPSVTNPGDATQTRSMFSAVSKALSGNFVQGPAFSGTGVSLQLTEKAMFSFAPGKEPLSTTAEEPTWSLRDHIYSDLPHLNEQQCLDYVGRYLDLSALADEDRARIGRMFRGRPRSSAGLVAYCLSSNVDIMTGMEQYITQITSDPAGLNPSPEGSDGPPSFFKFISGLDNKLLKFKPLYGESFPERVTDMLKDLSVRYALTGRPQDMSNELRRAIDNGAIQFGYNLVEQGICRLVRRENEHRAVIDEPLVVLAMCNKYGLRDSVSTMMRRLETDRPSLGKEFEKALATYVMSSDFTLLASKFEDHPALKDILNNDSQFAGYWKLDTSRGLLDGHVIGQLADDNCTLEQWLENPTSVFFFPENETGPDLVFFLINEQDRKIVVFLQSKLIQNNLPGKRAVHAANTTNGEAIQFTPEQLGFGLQGAVRNLDGWAKSKGYLRLGMLLSYPADVPSFNTQMREADCDLFIAGCGPARFGQLFASTVLDRLNKLYEP